MTFVIQKYIADGHKFILRLLYRPAENCFDTGNKFYDRERFLNIIVCPDVKSPNHVNLRSFGCYHDNRHLLCDRILADLFYNLISVFIRKHHIKNRQIRHLFFDFLVEMRCIIKSIHLMPAVF